MDGSDAPKGAPGAGRAADPAGSLWRRLDVQIALGSALGLLVHLVLRYGVGSPEGVSRTPLLAILFLGGGALLVRLVRSVLKGEWGADLLAWLSIGVSIALGQYLAGALIVLMLATGSALESFSLSRAASVLAALARRMPQVAHRRVPGGGTQDVSIDQVAVGDLVDLWPHDICPVDGVVVEGRGTMDEAYLTGEPFVISKTPGSEVLSGAINGETLLTLRAVHPAVDSRYAQISRVMRESERKRPRVRRLGAQLGMAYVPLAVLIAGLAWIRTGDSMRFLSVLVVATPCPLLIAIPVAVIGAISLAAKRTILIRDPAILERIGTVRTMIFDKTGTLTYGEPRLTREDVAPGLDADRLLGLVASVEQYSKHPLAGAIVRAARARRLDLREAENVSEKPGAGLEGKVDGERLWVTGRKSAAERDPRAPAAGAAGVGGLECVVFLGDRYAATYGFHDAPRSESRSFVGHLGPKHLLKRTLLVSGDRKSEVEYLAAEVGITEIHAGKTPEEKLALVSQETRRAPTLYLGDGINDAPALMAATVGIAFGQKSDVTAEAAGAVILEPTLKRVDELMHIGRRMRSIAIESAVGGMALSLVGMILAAMGWLPPVAGALVQEAIDGLAILNALRIAIPPRELSDF